VKGVASTTRRCCSSSSRRPRSPSRKMRPFTWLASSILPMEHTGNKRKRSFSVVSARR
jgi:hypothetical protein